LGCTDHGSPDQLLRPPSCPAFLVPEKMFSPSTVWLIMGPAESRRDRTALPGVREGSPGLVPSAPDLVPGGAPWP